MSSLTQLPDRADALALHERLVRACPGHTVNKRNAAAVALAIAADEAQLREAWKILGPWALRQLDRMVLMEGRARNRHGENGHEDRDEEKPSGQAIQPRAQTSWYQRLPLWKRPVAIGNTGRRKNLEDLTHGDCQTIAQFYMRSSTTLREKGDTWAAISRSLQGPETLKAASGKLAKSTLRFLQDETGGEQGND